MSGMFRPMTPGRRAALRDRDDGKTDGVPNGHDAHAHKLYLAEKIAHIDMVRGCPACRETEVVR